MNAELSAYFETRSSWVNRELKRLLETQERPAIPFLKAQPAKIRRAMLYSLMAGGKRLRPLLVMAAAEALGRPPKTCLKTACAMEMIHTYSLIHDDLPAMDDDDLRRGKPTNHKMFGEAIAILAGDGLLTYAFELIASNARDMRLPAPSGYELMRVIAAGAGTRGMIGGQVADIEAEGFDPRRLLNGGRRQAQRLLSYIHTHKTAALITASLEAGAILGQAAPGERRALREYGRFMGLAFQIADDILDVVGPKEILGKRGSDEANRKLTYARLHGIEKSRKLAQTLVARSHAALASLGGRGRILSLLADYVIERQK